MKKLLPVLILVVAFFGIKAIVNTLTNEPATGQVVIVEGEEVDVEPVDTLTVTVEPMPIPEPEPLPDPQPEVVVWKPLVWTKGSLKKFAAANGVKVMELKPQVVKYLKTLGVETDKGVKIDGDLYIKVGSKRYVVHLGKLIKL